MRDWSNYMNLDVFSLPEFLVAASLKVIYPHRNRLGFVEYNYEFFFFSGFYEIAVSLRFSPKRNYLWFYSRNFGLPDPDDMEELGKGDEFRVTYFFFFEQLSVLFTYNNVSVKICTDF